MVSRNQSCVSTFTISLHTTTSTFISHHSSSPLLVRPTDADSAHFVSIILLYDFHTITGCSAERAHLLQSVMRNVRSSTNYYRDAVLDFVFFEGDSLLAKHIENFKLGKARVET